MKEIPQLYRTPDQLAQIQADARAAERARVLAEIHAVLEPFRKKAMVWNRTGLRLLDELTALEQRLREGGDRG